MDNANSVAFLLAFGVWSVVHSVTAAPRFKGWVRQQIGKRAFDGLYRLAYNVFSVLTFLPLLWLLARLLPERPLWQIPTPWRWGAHLVQLLGLLGLAVTLGQTGIWRFAGLRQAAAYWRGEREPDSASTLVIDGAYRLVRHPLYFFSLLIIWFNPTMTLARLLFNVAATLYFWIGSVYEERKLVAEFGAAYREYQQRVPRLLPRPW